MKNYLLKSIFVLIMAAAINSCSSSSDACVPITCLNGGDSTSDCGCNCVPGFTGSDCSVKMTPTKVIITRVDITSFPGFNGVNQWDPSESGINMRPDIYYAIYQNSNYIFTSTSYIEDADGTQDYAFTNGGLPFALTSINSPIVIELRDYNASNNTFDLMGNTSPAFIYNPSDTTFPSVITFDNIPQGIQVKFYVTYEW